MSDEHKTYTYTIEFEADPDTPDEKMQNTVETFVKGVAQSKRVRTARLTTDVDPADTAALPAGKAADPANALSIDEEARLCELIERPSDEELLASLQIATALRESRP